CARHDSYGNGLDFW
nr:immunoglobulin heavy chain junction region [Macaca mulatta]MOX03327.1 immunoglobulin heavy chain junction region [Macaca mulatta]MOX03754.1 immunoglobulin heavy chain junction region [Macaca mulatta]